MYVYIYIYIYRERERCILIILMIIIRESVMGIFRAPLFRAPLVTILKSPYLAPGTSPPGKRLRPRLGASVH